MIYWDFNLVPENDTYPYNNEERLPDGKTYRAASLRGSERGKSVIFDLLRTPGQNDTLTVGNPTP